MAEPRLPSSIPRIDPYKLKSGNSNLLDVTWPVYKKYWIEEYTEPLPFIPDGSMVGSSPHFPWNYEKPSINVDFGVDPAIKGTLPPGSYICHSREIAREYNPLNDKGLLILELAKVGKNKEVTTSAIKEFVSTYGFLKMDDRFFPSINFGYSEYSVEAFHLYAREAYIVTSLYIELFNKSKGQALVLLSSYFEIDRFLATYEMIGNWRSILLNHYHHLPDAVKTKIQGDYEEQYNPDLRMSIKEWREHSTLIEPDGDPITDEDRIQFLESYKEDEEDEDLTYLYKTEELSTETWQEIVKNASDDLVFALSADLISVITNIRIGMQSGFYVEPVTPSGIKEKHTFKGSWSASSLLSAMWLNFYLTITEQHEDYYRTCPVCNRHIKNPHKNRIYHDNCRQVHYNRLRRSVIKLWKQGYSQQELLKATGASVEQIKRWIELAQK